jgi:hypothetical protein
VFLEEGLLLCIIQHFAVGSREPKRPSVPANTQ